jgi:hypothetical protein
MMSHWQSKARDSMSKKQGMPNGALMAKMRRRAESLQTIVMQGHEELLELLAALRHNPGVNHVE